MKKIILEGNNLHTNHGCEAIDRGTYHILRQQFLDCSIINCGAAGGHSPDARCGGAEEHFAPEGMTYSHYPRRHSVPWYFRKLRQLLVGDYRTRPYKPFPFEKHLHSADAVLTLGGDNWSLDYQRPEFVLESTKAIKKSGKPIIHWCSSIGPFDEDPDFLELVKACLKSYDLILVRESYSVDYLKSIGVSENVKQVADPAFLMDPQSKNDLDAELLDLLESGQECLGLNLAARLGHFPADRTAYLEKMVELVTRLVDSVDGAIVLIPHVMSSEIHACDQYFLSEIGEKVRSTGRKIYWVTGDWNAPELKWLIGQMSAFAGARTHSTIAALSSGVPTCFLSYSLKSKGICSDMTGGLDHLVSIKTGSISELSDRILYTWKCREDYRRDMLPVVEEMKRRAYSAGSALSDLLG